MASLSGPLAAELPPTPCFGCEFRPTCDAFPILDEAIYSNPSFRRSALTLNFLDREASVATVALLRSIVAKWVATARMRPDIPMEIVYPALFDFMISGLYAQQVGFGGAGASELTSITHPTEFGTSQFFPYIWMCPQCVSDGKEPADCYLPDALVKGTRHYARPVMLSRPGGRMIGDLGAIALRIIIEAVAVGPAHFTSGGGHRGEFDMVISTPNLLLLGEIKASPLVSFPIVVDTPAPSQSHTWVTGIPEDGDWSMFVGAAATSRRIGLSSPVGAGALWPLPDLESAADDAAVVGSVLDAWSAHLLGYRRFNAEGPGTRWHRFGCGNVETVLDGRRIQLRVDNTKSLPGIDRTDDIKKGIAQVMLFDRLKKGCRKDAVKTGLFGNLFAETHHEHYLKPLASVRLEWPGRDPVWLFDAIVALSRNIINDSSVGTLIPLSSNPYASDSLDASAFLEDLDEESGDEA